MCDANYSWAEVEAAKEQSKPVANSYDPIYKSVVADLYARHQKGVKTYGVPLQPYNKRDALLDAYQEALDLCIYLRQVLYERDGK